MDDKRCMLCSQSAGEHPGCLPGGNKTIDQNFIKQQIERFKRQGLSK